MDCPSDDDLSSYLAGRLDAAEQEAVSSHLLGCDACDALVEVLATRSPVGGLGASPAASAQGEHVEPREGDAVGRYVLQRVVGAGGMGVVWAAYDAELDRQVAIKLVRSTGGPSGAALRARFDREVRVTARLQHPSIVSLLEAGTWPSGEPFYVMKLVSGTSLDQVVAGRPTLTERLALLPNLIAVVDALAYAHRAGVIHRDLKPANVLVGRYGETVVIDWGLAKSLTASASAAADSEGAMAPTPPKAATPGATVAGSVMGTPAYMPPEQARGEAIDARADVYALGAMLYHLLTGAAPFAELPPAAVLGAVLAGPPPPLASRVRGAPADLITIVERAMSREAADRHPSAEELVDELKRFQTGQLVGSHRYSARELVTRWLRRHRMAVAVAGVAALCLAVLGAMSLRRIVREQQRAEGERAIAERSRADAEELVNFMLFDLRQKLLSVGREDLLGSVAQKALQYYEGQSNDHPADETLHRRAVGLCTLGDVLVAQGDSTEALARYRGALALAETLSHKDPSSNRWRHNLAVVRESLGRLLERHGDLAGALAQHRAAEAECRSFLKARLSAEGGPRQPAPSGSASGESSRGATVVGSNGSAGRGDAEVELDLSRALDLIGDVLRAQGDTDAALEQYRASLALDPRLAAQQPDDAQRLRHLSVVRASIGQILLARGDLAGAFAEHQAGLQIAERLALREPRNQTWQRDLAISHEDIARVLEQRGDLRAALAAYRAGKAVSERLAAADPSSAELQRDLSTSHAMVGTVLHSLGEMTGSLAEYRGSLVIVQRLAAREPQKVEWQRHLAMAYRNLADVLLPLRRVAEAEKALQDGLAITSRLAAADPANPMWQRDLARTRYGLGEVAKARGDRARILASFRQVLAIMAPLVAKDPTNVGWRKLVDEARARLASVPAR